MIATNTTNEASPAESAAGQDVTADSMPKPGEIADDVPHDLRFGAVVRHFRQKKGLTQSELSKALGHSTPEWAGMAEAGQRKIQLDEIPQLAAVLQLNARDLAKRALREYHPALAGALFYGQPDDHEVPGPAIGQAADLLPASAALARAFQKLKPKQRQIITSMVEALGENLDVGGRVGKKRMLRNA